MTNRLFRSSHFHPRHVLINTVGSTQVPGIPMTPATASRFSMGIAANRTVDPAPYAAVNADQELGFYLNITQVQRSTNLPSGTPLGGLVIWPGWWGTMAGTTLAAALASGATSASVSAAPPAGGWGTAPFYVQLADATRTVFEIAYCTAVTGNTLTLQRGVWGSAATAFAVGARIAQVLVVPSYPTSYYVNVTPSCPVEPATGRRWNGYVGAVVAATKAAHPAYTMVFFDSGDHHVNPTQTRLDLDLDNLADGGDTTTKTGTFDGIVQAIAAVRGQPGCAGLHLLFNGGAYNGLDGDGRLFEHVQGTNVGAPPPFTMDAKWQLYRALTTDATPAPVSVWAYDRAGSNVLDAAALKNYRFQRALACMGNGYFGYDFSTGAHGDTGMMDEDYQARGTCLAADIAPGDTTIPVINARTFMVGQTVRIPYPVQLPTTTLYEDEQLLITGIPDATHLQVQRNGVRSTHLAGQYVATDHQIKRGLGWLGMPLGPADNSPAVALLGANLITSNADFETFSAGAFPGWTYATSNGAVAVLSADTVNPHTGTQAAKVVVSTAVSGSTFTVKLMRPGIALQKGGAYTLRYWARTDRLQQMQARVLNSAGSTVCSQFIDLTTDWQQWGWVFYCNVTDTHTLQLEVGQEVGSYWLDTASLCLGDHNLWSRQFANGLVLANATPNSATFTLPAGNYGYLDGSQDRSVNNGQAAGPTVVVPGFDGRILEHR